MPTIEIKYDDNKWAAMGFVQVKKDNRIIGGQMSITRSTPKFPEYV